MNENKIRKMHSDLLAVTSKIPIPTGKENKYGWDFLHRKKYCQFMQCFVFLTENCVSQFFLKKVCVTQCSHEKESKN